MDSQYYGNPLTIQALRENAKKVGEFYPGCNVTWLRFVYSVVNPNTHRELLVEYVPDADSPSTLRGWKFYPAFDGDEEDD